MDERSNPTGAQRIPPIQCLLTFEALARLRSTLGDALFVSTSAGMQPTTRAKELALPMREASGHRSAVLRPAAPSCARDGSKLRCSLVCRPQLLMIVLSADG